MRHVSTVLPFVLGCWLIVWSGCSGGDSETKSASPSEVTGVGGASDEEVSCVDDPRVAVIAAGVSNTGGGGFTITLSSSDPEPPARGNNSWHVTLVDADGAPLTAAKLAVSAHMPDHGHMSPTTPKASPTDAQGSTTISGLNLFMAGVWVIDVQVTPDGAEEPADQVSFTFCVEG